MNNLEAIKFIQDLVSNEFQVKSISLEDYSEVMAYLEGLKAFEESGEE